MLRAGFHWQDIKEQLLFGLPFVPVGAASFILDLTDRWFLKHYYSTSEVGIYSLGYRFAEILTFVVTAFQLSWPQFLFKNRKEDNAPQLYADMTTYYAALMLFLWLGLAVFAPELLRIMATPKFYPAASLIPVVSFALVFDGMGFMFNIGALFSKKTLLRTASVTVAAVVNIWLNFLLIPPYGMMGAAWSTFVGFLVQMSTTLYPVAARLPRALPLRSPARDGRRGARHLRRVRARRHALAVDRDRAQGAVDAHLPDRALTAGLFEPKELAAALNMLERRVPRSAAAVRYLRPLVLRGHDASRP